MTKFVAFRFKSYLMDDGNSDKKVEGTKKCVIKVILKFNDYKNCLLNSKIILKSQNEAQSEAHDAYTKEINKIALSRHKYCKILIELLHIHMVQALEKYAKQNF